MRCRKTAALADQATDGFSLVARRLEERPGADVLVIGGQGQATIKVAFVREGVT